MPRFYQLLFYILLLFISTACKEEWLSSTTVAEAGVQQDVPSIIEREAQWVEWLQNSEEMPYLAECNCFDTYTERKQCSDRKMLEVIYSNFKYPPIMRDFCGGGIIVIGFVVDKDGSVVDHKIARGIFPPLDEEALRVVKLLPAFIPGRMMGQPVAVQYNVPIRICLQ